MSTIFNIAEESMPEGWKQKGREKPRPEINIKEFFRS